VVYLLVSVGKSLNNKHVSRNTDEKIKKSKEKVLMVKQLSVEIERIIKESI